MFNKLPETCELFLGKKNFISPVVFETPYWLKINSEGGFKFLINSTDLGSYIATFSGGSEVSDKLYEVGQTASVYAVRTFADGTSDIGFQQVEYNYAPIIA